MFYKVNPAAVGPVTLDKDIDIVCMLQMCSAVMDVALHTKVGCI
jgi:hypothetical protein